MAILRMGADLKTILLLSCIFSIAVASNKTENERREKALSVFNVVTFPNSACGATSGFNGTCYTAAECSSLGGTASGTCASSFGVCCVFSISCGTTSSQNNTYAIISSYSTSADKDPCTYTYCKSSSDVCKLRIDYDTMVLTAPQTTMVPTTALFYGISKGSCYYDTLSISSPGFQAPPTVCGYNTGQHMWVPASDSCTTINIDIDTGTTTTTRKWQIKVSQYECGNMMAPENDCLQYFTESTGTIATFNWDTSATTVASSQTHLQNQHYDICIRRARSSCSLCLSPQITSTTTGTAGSYGLGASSDGSAPKNALGSTCTGVTTAPAAVGYGDYIEIVNLQPSIGTTGTLTTANRMCSNIFNAITTATIAHATACTWATPFKVGVHFDNEEALKAACASPNLKTCENDVAATTGAGYGTSGFWLAYWQNTC